MRKDSCKIWETLFDIEIISLFMFNKAKAVNKSHFLEVPQNKVFMLWRLLILPTEKQNLYY